MTLDTADRVAVLDLYARYAHAIDSGDSSSCAACFTQDGVLRVDAGKPVTGRESLERFAAKWRANFQGVPRHIWWHVLLKPEGNYHVKGTASAALLGTTTAGTSIVFSGRYEDRFERSADGKWLIAERFVITDTVSSPEAELRSASCDDESWMGDGLEWGRRPVPAAAQARGVGGDLSDRHRRLTKRLERALHLLDDRRL
jgi:ketosteroid isomerase-like protein